MGSESDFIGGRFFEGESPAPGPPFLYKYFDTGVQRQFLRYYLMFRETAHFVDRTGHAATYRWLRKLELRVLELERAMAEARKAGDFEAVARLESGKHPTP